MYQKVAMASEIGASENRPSTIQQQPPSPPAQPQQEADPQPQVFSSCVVAAAASRPEDHYRDLRAQDIPNPPDFWWLPRRALHDSDEDDICELNSIDDEGKCVKRANQLEINCWYPAETIKKIRTEFGMSYVVTSENFKFFLPRRYSNMSREIKPFMRGRQFLIKGFYKRGSDTTPILTFKKVSF